ncbi:DUF742 domain-containing protein [Saccharopolyspora sp. K220]|uniref:DUF742 domain-containing protein n=1 Tax=Saccharopolyspora soli TaxID=2926618 RepID=UPI001F58ADE3|nr:DUF742 domain-containing protein [Saccharopolyspora soli]MCI2416635.1 DUF742 domain-containing protein [Saccharopolyspora soli]
MSQDDDSSIDGRLVRPFSMRRGRTSSRRTELNMSTLIWTVRGDSPSGELSPEQEQILELCRRRHHSRQGVHNVGQPGVGIAEVAALLDIPMAVTKVLVSELIDRELLMFSQPATGTEQDLALMKKVWEGLHALRG